MTTETTLNPNQVYKIAPLYQGGNLTLSFELEPLAWHLSLSLDFELSVSAWALIWSFVPNPWDWVFMQQMYLLRF